MPIPTIPARPRRLALVKVAGSSTQETQTLAEAVRRGLTGEPKRLPFQFFYDDVGSQLFEQICELPEYYLTRTEDSILREQSDAMIDGWDHSLSIIELGSGSSTKTQRLIASALRTYGEVHYAPIDVSSTILEESARTLVEDFPGLRVTGYAGDYRVALRKAFGSLKGPKLVVFLGSSIGNYEIDEAVELLAMIAQGLGPADRLLLGTDLAKDRATLEAAYDDASGVTAQFNKNLLVRINRELGANFDPDRFAHRARYRRDRGRVEIHLVSLEAQVVQIPEAELEVRFGAQEAIHTENSHKYSLETLHELARRSGFVEESSWTDPAGWFRVQRWRPTQKPPSEAGVPGGP